MLGFALAFVAALALAWWSWRDRLGEPLGRLAAASRAFGLVALLLLLIDPGLRAGPLGSRAIVLLDNSLSMHATGARHDEAARLAASLGDTTSFGEMAPGEPGGRSALSDALTGAVARGRAVVVVTDGEISDAELIPPDVLQQAEVRLAARAAGADIALTEVRAPLRLAADDSLWLEIAAQRTADAPDSAAIEVRDSGVVVLKGMLRFSTSRHARLRLAGALARGTKGERWLEVVRMGAADAEAGDDIRWWRVVVTPTPGIVVLASAPDWDARFLYRTLRDVGNAPVRGYAQLESGRWRRMDDLRVVPAADVIAAARAADLLAVRGDVTPWRTAGRARLLWPVAEQAGDWYVDGGGPSPVAGAFVGVVADSLPPLTAIHPLVVDSGKGWSGASARQARRGAAQSVVVGSEGAGGRTVTFGADGLYRWALRGGVSEQAWRGMVAGAAAWLLASPDADGTKARPMIPVTQRGARVRFRWTGAGAATPLAMRLEGGAAPRVDTLRFDGNGEAAIVATTGRYRYAIENGGGQGSFAVEPYADELVPAAVTVAAHQAGVAPTAARRSLRELLWLFAFAVIGFGGEWMLRRRLGGK